MVTIYAGDLGIMIFVILLILSLGALKYYLNVEPEYPTCKKHYWIMRRKDNSIEDYLVCKACDKTPEDVLND